MIKSIRLTCMTKSCNAKLTLFCSTSDRYDDNFFNQKFELEPKDFEKHSNACCVSNAWESLANAFINHYNLANRAKPVKMTQREIRTSLIKMLNMSVLRAASIFVVCI